MCFKAAGEGSCLYESTHIIWERAVKEVPFHPRTHRLTPVEVSSFETKEKGLKKRRP